MRFYNRSDLLKHLLYIDNASYDCLFKSIYRDMIHTSLVLCTHEAVHVRMYFSNSTLLSLSLSLTSPLFPFEREKTDHCLFDTTYRIVCEYIPWCTITLDDFALLWAIRFRCLTLVCLFLGTSYVGSYYLHQTRRETYVFTLYSGERGNCHRLTEEIRANN